MTTDPEFPKLAAVPAQAPEPEQPQMIPPAPVPELWTITSGVMPDGQPAVILQISTPLGISIHFLARDNALAIASMMKKTAQTGPQIAVPPTAGKLILPS